MAKLSHPNVVHVYEVAEHDGRMFVAMEYVKGQTLREWLQAYGVTQVALESTGVYWKPVYYVLEDAFELLLINMQQLQHVPGRKTDVKDSEWLAQLLECGLLRGSFVPPVPIRELRDITRNLGYDPRHLELELTERGLMHHPKRVLRHLKEFRRLGIQVAVDDFGTGYSCLGLMKRFPLHALKIDRSFVRDCATDPTNQALVAAIIRMGHALGLSVTAEGVETSAQLAYLRQQRCDRAQGTYFSRPIPGQELIGMLRRHEKLVPRKFYAD